MTKTARPYPDKRDRRRVSSSGILRLSKGRVASEPVCSRTIYGSCKMVTKFVSGTSNLWCPHGSCRFLQLRRRQKATGIRGAPVDSGVVYHWCMSRTNIDLDDAACRSVMERYHLLTKRDAVNFALRIVAAEPLDLEASRALRGSGWEGDLEEMRAGRAR